MRISPLSCQSIGLSRFHLFPLTLTEFKLASLLSRCGVIALSLHGGDSLPKGWGREEGHALEGMGVEGAVNDTSTANMSPGPLVARLT